MQRAVLGAASLLLVLLSLGQGAKVRGETRFAAAVLRDTGLGQRHDTLAVRIRREGDGVAGRLWIARLLLEEMADQSWLASLPPTAQRTELDALPERIELANDIARAAVAERPTSWAGPMVLGGALFLQRYHDAAPELFTRRQEWEELMARAVALAPGHSAPVLMQCTAFIRIWGSLDESERLSRRALLSECFEDPRDFRAAADRWLVAATSDEEAFSVVPAHAEAWAVVADRYRRQELWDGWQVAVERQRSLVRDDLSADLETARRLLQGGAGRDATDLLLSAASRAPVDLAVAPLLAQIIDLCPPGAPSEGEARLLRRHLDWALDLCVRGLCPLTPGQLDRLAVWGRVADTETLALLQLTRGELNRAETTVRRAEAPLATDEWAPYLVLRARLQLERGRRTEAAETLDGLAPSAARWAVARALRGLIDPTHDDLAVGTTAWSAHEWRWNRGAAALDLIASRPAPGLVILDSQVSGTGSAIEARWDGRVTLVTIAQAGSALRLEVDVTPGPHLLSLQTLGGRPVIPGDVHLASKGRDLRSSATTN